MNFEEALELMKQGKWVKGENTVPLTIVKNSNGVEFLLEDHGVKVLHDIRAQNSLHSVLMQLTDINNFSEVKKENNE